MTWPHQCPRCLRWSTRTSTSAHQLRPHERVGVGRGGTLLYQCVLCRHERVYGTTMWATW